MGIYKLPKNQWTKDGRKYKYYWNEKDKNGKWKKSFSKAYKTKLDAMNAEREFLNSKVEFGGDMDMTFGTLTDQYIESQKNKVRKRTMETYLKRRRYFTEFENVKMNYPAARPRGIWYALIRTILIVPYVFSYTLYLDFLRNF